MQFSGLWMYPFFKKKLIYLINFLPRLGDLSSLNGNVLTPPAVEAQSLNHWALRKSLDASIFES